MINPEQAHLLADLARTIRPKWDTRGIVAALEKIDGKPIADIAAATLRAAADPNIRLPAGIPLDGPHWSATQTLEAQERLQQQQRWRDELAERAHQRAIRRQAIANCALCDERGYRGTWLCDHDPDTPRRAAAGVALAAAEIRPRPEPATPQVIPDTPKAWRRNR